MVATLEVLSLYCYYILKFLKANYNRLHSNRAHSCITTYWPIRVPLQLCYKNIFASHQNSAECQGFMLCYKKKLKDVYKCM